MGFCSVTGKHSVSKFPETGVSYEDIVAWVPKIFGRILTGYSTGEAKRFGTDPCLPDPSDTVRQNFLMKYFQPTWATIFTQKEQKSLDFL